VERQAFENKKLALQKALNGPYQAGDDLYAKYVVKFNDKTGNVSGSTKLWKPVLDQNPGAYFNSYKAPTGEYGYYYNGVDSGDIISTGYSIGGTARTQTTRNDMVINTKGGDDIIALGRDIGRNYSAGYFDKKYNTNMGDGDDLLIVGLGNNDVQLHLRDDASVGIVGTGSSVSEGEVLSRAVGYDKGTGGMISSTNIDMGSGDDTVLALGFEGNSGNTIVNSVVDLSSGNDTMLINGSVGPNTTMLGGHGIDTLVIASGNVSSDLFTGFEKIELGNKAGVHIQHNYLLFQDHRAVEGGILKITGSSTSRVNLDGDRWSKVGLETEGNVNYNVYTNDSVPNMKVLIDDNITNVI
ncbi:TPA: hypothetical protein OMI62_004765, partial [Escherichia coli]|nr:hypothetical protein [Escherichia coli]HCQ9044661.1 hypothetical protein [Escherichia coli]